ncbi:MAG TPA: hypothetical protein VF529_00910 [Solirubrobacteraceae bacterium]
MPCSALVGHVDRHHHLVRCHDGVDRQQPEARRAVDDDIVVRVDAALERVGEKLLAVVLARKRELEAGQLAAGCEQVDARLDVAHHRVVEVGLASEQLERGPRRVGRRVTEAPRERELRVEIDREDATPRQAPRHGEVGGCGGLADPALLGADGDDSGHGPPSDSWTARQRSCSLGRASWLSPPPRLRRRSA